MKLCPVYAKLLPQKMNEHHIQFTWSTNTSLAMIQDNYLQSIYNFPEITVEFMLKGLISYHCSTLKCTPVALQIQTLNYITSP